MTIDQHLAHLLSLMEPDYAHCWADHVEFRAKELAKDPEYAELPKMLRRALDSKKHGPPRPSTNARSRDVQVS